MQPTPESSESGRVSSDAVRLFEEMDRMRKVWKNFKPGDGFTKNNLGLLAEIDRMERNGRTNLTVGELAARMRQSAPAVSQKASALEQQGYLERVGNPSDRRVCYVRLTQSGRQAAQEGFNLFMGRVDTALGELGAEQVETLLRLMGALTDALARQTDTGRSGQSE